MEIKCKGCGELTPEDELFKGVCEKCLSKVYPGKEICARCEKEWATHNLNSSDPYVRPVCDKCSADESYLLHCIMG